MADKCIACEKKLSFWEGQRCNECMKTNKWPEGHENSKASSEGSELKSAETDKAKSSSSPSTNAADFAYLCALVIGLLSLLSAFLVARNGEFLLAFIIVVSGLTSAAILAVLAEISHNTAITAKSSKKAVP